MSRGITYSKKVPAAAGGAAAQAAPGGAPPTSPSPDDSYTERLAKYVPGETLAFFVPLAAFIGSGQPVWLWVILAVGVVGTPLYLWANTRSDQTKRLPHYFVLVTIAFVIWAFGVDPDYAKMVGLPPMVVTVVMGIAVFLLPGIDTLLAALNI